MAKLPRHSKRHKYISASPPIPGQRTMSKREDKEDFSDEELEEIIDMHAPKGQVSVAEFRKMIRENPILVASLVFTFGLLLGVSLRSRRR